MSTADLKREARWTDRIPTILEFVEGRNWLALEISAPQRVLLKAIYGLALAGDEEREIYERCTGRVEYVADGVGYSEVTVVAGARSGKDSRIAAPIALYEGIFGGHEVAAGEVGVIPLFAQNAEATAVAFQYIAAYGQRTRLTRFVDDEKGTRLELTSASGQPMRVVCFPCSSKAIRGFSVPAAVMDEVAFFRADSGKIVDKEVQRAIRRGMVGFSRRRLVKISTPSAQIGVLHEDFERYFGKDGARDVLVWHAPTTLMNPKITEADLAEDRRKDPLAAKREYDAEFVGDEATAYLTPAWIEAAVAAGVYQREPVRATAYRGAVDPSGGGADEFTLAVAHVEDGRIVQDVMRAWKGSRTNTVKLSGVVSEIAAILKRYGIGTVVGDHFAGAWVAQEFAKHGIAYTKAEQKKYAYLETKPAFQEGRVALLDDGTLRGQLAALQETWHPGSRVPTVDHPRGGHDDRANALAIVVAEFMRRMSPAIGGTLESYAADRKAAKIAAGEKVEPNEVDELERMYARPSFHFYGRADRPRVGMFR